ncbi:MAG: hypothetical protein KDA88_23220 [Planctomycetaceae bacterium]|nr:hypothetical protein [Planctomycetaceae bacterium]MCB9951775.1 hypothetical protein [Planctomycetaceae bacterium]
MAHSATQVEIGDHFRTLRDQWKSQTKYMSNTAQMATVWPYQQIIGMGPSALPLILAELQRETDHWFWALEAISGENPVQSEQEGRVEEMAKAWLDWGRQQGLI